MTFTEAFKVLQAGGKVKLPEWNFYIFLLDGEFVRPHAKHKTIRFRLAAYHIEAEDWEGLEVAPFILSKH